jgi:hypothetical protein
MIATVLPSDHNRLRFSHAEVVPSVGRFFIRAYRIRTCDLLVPKKGVWA